LRSAAKAAGAGGAGGGEDCITIGEALALPQMETTLDGVSRL
jgi:hypothetical protein